MAANIYSKLLYSPTLDNYNTANTTTTIPDSVIAFVGDDKTIRTQGLIFGGSLGEENDGAISISLGGSTATLSVSGHMHTVATTVTAGFMSYTDKIKLNGIEDNANNYSLPIASDTILGGVKAGTTNAQSKIYGVNIDEYGGMTVNVPWISTAATTATAGLMSAEDKYKLDNMAAASNPENYYWANINLSSTSSSITLPTFAAVTLGSAKLQYNSTDKSLEFIFS